MLFEFVQVGDRLTDDELVPESAVKRAVSDVTAAKSAEVEKESVAGFPLGAAAGLTMLPSATHTRAHSCRERIKSQPNPSSNPNPNQKVDWTVYARAREHIAGKPRVTICDPCNLYTESPAKWPLKRKDVIAILLHALRMSRLRPH